MCLELDDFNDMVIKLTKSSGQEKETQYSPVVIKTILDMFSQLDDEAKFKTIITAAQKNLVADNALAPLLDKKPFFLDYKTLIVILSGAVTLIAQLVGNFNFSDLAGWINEFLSIANTVFFR